jgi:hypothetical protein
MTTVANRFDLNQAFRLRMVLQCAGIDSFIPEENSATITPHYFFASGVRLQVADDDVDKARPRTEVREQLTRTLRLMVRRRTILHRQQLRWNHHVAPGGLACRQSD